MSITAYVGLAGTGKSQACYQYIEDCLHKEPGRTIILLVPDSATYQVERELAEFMPGRGFANVRVVGFRRLAYQVFQSLGRVHNQKLSKSGRQLLLRLLMKKQGAQLDLLRQVGKYPHFADVLQGLFTECDAFQVNDKDLEEVAASLGKEGGHFILQKKLEELAHLKKAYDEALAQRLSSGENTIPSIKDPLEELIDVLPKASLVRNAYLIVDGFHWFTPLQEALIHTLISLAKETVITVTAPTDKKRQTYESKTGHLFSRPLEILTHLRQQYGQQLVERTFTKPFRFQTAALSAMVSGFFSRPSQVYQGQEGLILYEGYNRAVEADRIARAICQYMMDRTHRYRQIMLVMRDSDTYRDVLEKALAQYDIPYFSDRTRPMNTHPLAEFFISLFDLVRSHFSHDALFRLLKTDLFPLSRADVDQLENYCLEFGIEEKGWLSQAEWNYDKRLREALEANENKIDLEAKENRDLSVSDEEMLDDEKVDGGKVTQGTSPLALAILRQEQVNKTRQEVMTYVGPLYTFAQKDHLGRDWCLQLMALVKRLQVPNTLQKWVQLAETDGQPAIARSHEQMYKHFLDLLDEIVVVADEDKLAAADVALLLEEGLAEETYSLVPPTLDHVLITSIERSYTKQADVVFVVGLNEGVFPQRIGDEGLLKDKERQLLAQYGLVLAAGALARGFNEQFLFYLAMTRARKQVILSCAGVNEKEEHQEMALWVKRLQQYGYISQVEVVPLTIEAGQEADYVWRPRQSLARWADELGRMHRLNHMEGGEISSIWMGLYQWGLTGAYRPLLSQYSRGLSDTNRVEAVDKHLVEAILAPQGVLTGSVTRLEGYQRCPYQFFSQYVLQVVERPVKTFGAPEVGIYLHDSLRKLGESLLVQKQQWRDLSDTEQEAYVDKLSKEAVEEAFGQETDAYQEQMAYRMKGLMRRSVERFSRWSKDSDFAMTYVEQGFGTGPHSWRPIYIPLADNKAIRLQGQLDRVDMYRTASNVDYAMVIDYKTGSTAVSMEDVYYGLKLQLVTYLLALQADRPDKRIVEPAAVTYSYIRNPKTSYETLLSQSVWQALQATRETVENRLSKSEADRTDGIKRQVSDGASPSEEGVSETEMRKEAKAKKALTKVLTEINKKVKSSGFFLDDKEILAHIDKGLGAASGSYTSSYIPISLLKSGDLSSDTRKTVYSRDDFAAMTEYVQRLMGYMGQEILEGQFPIRPYKQKNTSACKYCAYKALCRFDSSREGNYYRQLDTLDKEQVLDKMKEGGATYEMDK